MLRAQFPPARRPACPKCGYVMSRAELIPGMSIIGRQTFVCARCGDVEYIPEPVALAN
jgi:ribosomal protein S27AE